MKKIFILCSIVALALYACDKVENAYPENSTGLDPALYPGNINDYVIPAFSANTNTDRNVLIEDFTGHTCIYCPLAADEAHALEVANPGRVFTSTIHSGPDGGGVFQVPDPPKYTYDFTNAVSSEIGVFFGNLAGNNFSANPCGNVSRIIGTAPSISTGKDDWSGKVNSLLGANDLKVNLQTEVSYFGQTHGAFVHVEVEELQTVSNELRLVVAFYQDSIVKPQKFPGNIDSLTYVHRDLLIDHVQGGMNGQKINPEEVDQNGKYYYDYSYALPANIAADNAHLLIYVFDKVTHEVYQVIKKKFI